MFSLACAFWGSNAKDSEVIRTRHQCMSGAAPGVATLLLVRWIAAEVVGGAALLAVFAVFSMVRNSLRFLPARLCGQRPEFST